MNRYARMGLVFALLPVAACSSMGMNTTATPAAQPAPTALAANDAAFVTAAANAGEGEIQLGTLAQNKGYRIGIRKYAAQMVTDHTTDNQLLIQIARSKGMTVTPTISPEDSTMLQQLQGETGLKFDKDYISGQVTAHEKTVDLFQQEAQSGTDTELKQFAAQTLPQLRQHLKMAQTENHTEDRILARAARRHK